MVKESSNKRKIIADIIEDAYAKAYKMRMVGPGSLEATIPRAIVEREAKKHGLSLKSFVQFYKVEWLFNDFGGAFTRFIRIEEQGESEESTEMTALSPTEG